MVHRLGPDLQLVPLAFHEGITWWREMLNDLPLVPPHPAWPLRIDQATDTLLNSYEDVYTTCTRLDNRLWSLKTPPPKRLALFALYPEDKVRWFLHDPGAQTVQPANLLGAPPPAMETILAEMRPSVGDTGDKPVVGFAIDVKLEPIPGRPSVPDHHILGRL